jgi:hypothetical protein
VDARADLPIGVEAAEADGAVTRVELLANGVSAAGRTAPPYTFELSSALNPGRAVLTALAVDGAGRPSMAAPLMSASCRRVGARDFACIPARLR